MDPLNTAPIQQFISRVKSADASNAREVKLELQEAKRLAFTLGEVMARINGDLEVLLAKSNTDDQVIQINMDAGAGWK